MSGFDGVSDVSLYRVVGLRADGERETILFGLPRWRAESVRAVLSGTSAFDPEFVSFVTEPEPLLPSAPAE